MGLLAIQDASIGHYGQTFDVALNFIGEIIKWLVSGVGIVGVGIILFSLILKLIVLPFDILQRVNMRKQNQKMKENQEKLQKLQKQYANDKQKYNEKMMEFYKANGISMFSSCLPMILSMVIFFVAIGAFNSYSQYANINNYNTMVNAYNQSIESYTADVNEDNLIYTKVDSANAYVDSTSMDGATYLTFKDQDANSGKYIYIRIPYAFDTEESKTKDKQISYTKAVLNGEIMEDGKVKTASYYIDSNKAYTEIEEIEDTLLQSVSNPTDKQKEDACKEYFRMQAKNAVEESYNKTVQKNMGFLWIKNIWQTDASYKHPVLSYSDFESSMSKEKFYVKYTDGKVSYKNMEKYTSAYNEDTYEVVTANLGEQKGQANGYFILIALSIGTILLQQFISMKSQKAQSQYASVDGQQGSQQKIMLVVMTGMFAVFAFLYSAAFSIYMITSNIISLISMLLINKIVDTVMEKKEQQRLVEKYTMRNPGKQKTTEGKNKKK